MGQCNQKDSATKKNLLVWFLILVATSYSLVCVFVNICAAKNDAIHPTLYSFYW